MLELRSASYIRIYFLEEELVQDFLLALLAAVLDGRQLTNLGARQIDVLCGEVGVKTHTVDLT